MKVADNSILVAGKLQPVWEKLVHWQTMHEWDVFMDRVVFDGPLKLGSKGKLKMKNGPEVDLIVTSFDPPFSYTDEFTVMGSRFKFFHELVEDSDNAVTLRITAEVEGLVATLLAPLMRKDLGLKMPTLMNNFKQKFESQRNSE